MRGTGNGCFFISVLPLNPLMPFLIAEVETQLNRPPEELLDPIHVETGCWMP
jgi:hypothetical protein